MNADVQTWLALGIVVIAAILLARAWWRRRDSHEGCDCPGAKAGRELRRFKR